MNKAELERNPVLTEIAVVDLNATPELPYEDNSFDFITNAVSVDYLRQPLPVFRCVHLPSNITCTTLVSFISHCNVCDLHLQRSASST